MHTQTYTDPLCVRRRVQIDKRAAEIAFREKIAAKRGGGAASSSASTVMDEMTPENFAEQSGGLLDVDRHLALDTNSDLSARRAPLGSNVHVIKAIHSERATTAALLYEVEWFGYKHTTLEPSAQLQAYGP